MKLSTHLQGGNDYEIFEFERTIGHTGWFSVLNMTKISSCDMFQVICTSTPKIFC